MNRNRATNRASAQPQRHACSSVVSIASLICVALAGFITLGCGVEAREYSPELNPTLALQAAELGKKRQRKARAFEWPEPGAEVAVLHVAGRENITLRLFPDVAPETVANFVKLAKSGFYDGTTFHRVIPKFMIQGGDPNTRDDDPKNDGTGGPGYKLKDEFSNAPHVRGVVSMANTGGRNSAGSQFFIVQKQSDFLNRKYAAFAQVESGMETVDAISRVKRDKQGRWGPKDRPLESVVIERITIEPAGKTLASRE